MVGTPVHAPCPPAAARGRDKPAVRKEVRAVIEAMFGVILLLSAVAFAILIYAVRDE